MIKRNNFLIKRATSKDVLRLALKGIQTNLIALCLNMTHQQVLKYCNKFEKQNKIAKVVEFYVDLENPTYFAYFASPIKTVFK